MANNNEEITNPSYHSVVEPMLREHEGNAIELRRLYPNFDPETVTTGGLPYLHLACRKNHFQVVRGLLECGASLRRKSGRGSTALYYACHGNQESRADMIMWLLSEHADARSTVNWADDNGWTGLHLAAAVRATAIVRVLLAYGADITLKSTHGETPSEVARRYGNIETTEVLVKAKRCLKQIETGEWRPWNHVNLPRLYQNAMYTLVILAKAIVID